MTRSFTKGIRTSFYTMLFFMGALFWIATETGHFHMSALVYGEQAVALPARLWAAGMLVPSSIYLAALRINGARRWTPYVRIGCGFLMSSYFSLFIFSALPAAGGDLMVVSSVVLMLKAAALTYIDASELLVQWGRDERRGTP